MKKIWSVLLCLTMILSLAACGNGKSTEGTNNPPQTDQSGEPAQSDDANAPKTSGLKIAYSVGYVGNAWRSQHVASLEEAAEAYKADGTIAEFQVVSADNDSTTQISQCNAMLAEGLDALLICAVSPTTLT